MRLPYFPIVPRNAPPDDLVDYLRLYSREAVGMNPPWPPSHAEWDVNLRIPRMFAQQTEGLRGTGPFVTEMEALEGAFRPGRHSTLGAFGAVVGVDPTLAFPSTGIAKVSALWAQRAVNALYAAQGRSTRVVTDGAAGPRTLEALRELRLRWLAGLPVPLPTSPRVIAMPAIVDRGHVTIAGDFMDAMQGAERVPDVAAPTPTSPVVPPDDVAPAPSGGASGGVVLAVALGLGAAMWFGRRR